MRIAPEQQIHAQMGHVRVEQMMFVPKQMNKQMAIVFGMAEIARGVHLGYAMVHNH